MHSASFMTAGKKRALVFFPHNPYPAKSGAHRRCLSVLETLKGLGYEVHFFGSDLFSETSWDVAHQEAFTLALNVKLKVYTSTHTDRFQIDQASDGSGPVSFAKFVPMGLRASFESYAKEIQPDLVFINYAMWGALISSPIFQGVLKVIESHDLFTQNSKMVQLLNRVTPKLPITLHQINDEYVDPQFLSGKDASPALEEFDAFDLFDYTIAISEAEASEIRRHTRRTRVIHIPVYSDIDPRPNHYEGGAVFAIGPNAFNLQGYAYFIKKVLPLIRERRKDFLLEITGKSQGRIEAVPGVSLLGFIDDLSEKYKSASFAISPLLSGTGQQVKVLEAMAHGLPVVIHASMAHSAPIIHGKNGFVANNDVEFAEYCIRLWSDRELCREMGDAALQTVRSEFSEEIIGKIFQSQIIDHFSEVGHPAPKTKPPRIVIDGVFFQISNSGIARVWRCLLESWARLYPDADIILLNRNQTAPQIDGIRNFPAPKFELLASAMDSEILQSICDQLGADVFLSTYYTYTRKTPTVMLVHDMIPERLGIGSNPGQWASKKIAMINARALVMVSRNTEADVIDLIPDLVKHSRRVAHCGVEENFKPSNEPSTAKPYFLFVGERKGISGYKNVDLLLKALGSLQDHPEFEMLFVGGARELEPEILELKNRIKIRHQRLDDAGLISAYSGALGLIYPSLYEGFGLPVLEAMATGCPVIACQTSSIPEVGGDAVFYVEPHDPQSLLHAMKEIQKPAIRTALREKGLKRAREFSWDQMARTVMEAVQEVHGSQPVGVLGVSLEDHHRVLADVETQAVQAIRNLSEYSAIKSSPIWLFWRAYNKLKRILKKVLT